MLNQYALCAVWFSNNHTLLEDIQWDMLERTQLVLEPCLLQHVFVLAYIEIYVFRGNPLEAHSLEQCFSTAARYRALTSTIPGRKHVILVF
jgi:hypothetical protein